jgi:hypothetical protein
MYKDGSLEELSVKTTARGGHRLFLEFRPFVASEIIQNEVGLRISNGYDLQAGVRGTYA